MKSIRRMIMVGTIAFAITLNSGLWSHTANANQTLTLEELEAHRMLDTNHYHPVDDELHKLLGFSSDEELYEATYNYQTLAEIAAIQDVDVQKIIDLQSSQLMVQLDMRLAKGQLTLHEYSVLTTEVPDMIRNSVYGQ